MSARDDLRAAVERLAAEFHGATLGTDFYGNPLSGWVPVARLRTLLAEHPAPEPLRKPWCLCDPGFGPHDADCPAIAETPEPPSAPEVTAEELAEVIWTISRADESTISATGANHVAAAIFARFDVRRRP